MHHGTPWRALLCAPCCKDTQKTGQSQNNWEQVLLPRGAHGGPGTSWGPRRGWSRGVGGGGINAHALWAWVFAMERMWAVQGSHGASPLRWPGGCGPSKVNKARDGPPDVWGHKVDTHRNIMYWLVSRDCLKQTNKEKSYFIFLQQLCTWPHNPFSPWAKNWSWTLSRGAS